MIFEIFKKERKKPIYLHRLDELPKLDIVRLKGRLDQTTIPFVEARIIENRKMGSKIDRNLLLDFALVEHVDTALIASQIVHFQEYQAKGFTIAVINVSQQFLSLIEIFKEKEFFRIYHSEDQAIKELSR